MKRTPTAVACLLASVLVVTACSGQESSGGATTSIKDLELVDITDRPAGDVEQLSWALFEEPNSLDPDRADGTDADAVLANVCEGLFRLEPDLSATPLLAAKVDRPDDRTFVLTIRDGVTFHSGREMEPADVVWSLERHANPQSGESDEFANVRAIKQTAKDEVTITLDSPDPQLAYRLAGGAGIILDRKVAQKQGQDYGTAGSTDACTGPYELAEWAAGSKIVLTRFDDYWDTDGAARNSKVTFTWGNEASVANTLRTGAADGAFLAEPTLVPTLTNVDGLKIYYGASTGAEKLIPTERGGELDPRIRKALSLAIDREGIVQAGYQGIGDPWSTPVGPGAWGYGEKTFEQAAADAEGAPASPSKDDLDAARDLVKEAGAPSRPLVVASNGTKLRNVIANAVLNAGEQIGVEVKIQTFSDAGYGELFSSSDARREVDFLSDDWYLSKPEPLGLYDNLLPGESSNYLGYQNKKYVDLYRKAASTYDEAARAELVVELQQIALDDMLWIPLAAAPNTLVMSEELTGAPVSFAYRTYPWAARIGQAG